MIRPWLPTLRARSCWVTEPLFLIAHSMQRTQVQYESSKSCISSAAKHDAISTARLAHDAEHRHRFLLTRRAQFEWRGDQTRNHATLQEHDRDIRYHHRSSGRRTLARYADAGERTADSAL